MIYVAGQIGDQYPDIVTRSLEAAMLLVFRSYLLSKEEPPTPPWTCRFVGDDYGEIECLTTWTGGDGNRTAVLYSRLQHARTTK